MSNVVVGLLAAAGALFLGLIVRAWLASPTEPSDNMGDPASPDVFDGSGGRDGGDGGD